MLKFGISQPVRRVEDTRFLRGVGRYVDDINRPGALHAVFVRAPHGHADIGAIDTENARNMPGVRLVLCGRDLDQAIDNTINGMQIENRDGSMSVLPRRPVLAVDRVRHVGEAVACVIADTLDQARDGAEQLDIVYEERPAVVETAHARDPDAPQVHDTAPGNLCYDWGIGDQAKTRRALADAQHRVTLDLVNNRVISNPMETRGVVAWMEEGRLFVNYNGQGVWDLKNELARCLRLDAGEIRVMTTDVGGGFGTKAINYPEHFVVAHAARILERPVQWIAERGEGMLSDSMGRDTISHIEAGFDADYKMVALQVETTSNLGAYASASGVIIQSDLAARVLTGAYDIGTAWFHVHGVFTNTAPVDAYRGAGRPEAQYVLERLMDKSARLLGVDPVELRQINFIRPDQMPYDTITGEHYDVGDFDRVLRRGVAEADWAGFPERHKASAKNGRLRGRGLCFYIESILGAQNETAEIAFAGDGHVDLMVGTQSNGQGHETVFRQFLHSRTGIPFEKIRVVQGDSDRIAGGGGTGGSRSVTMQGTAINGASDDLIAKMKPLAEEELEVSGADLVWQDGAWSVRGTDKRVSLMALAERARATGRHELLSQQTETVVPGRSYPNGCHVAEVEIDPDTGVLQVVRYTVTDDFGLLINPMLAEGQVHGGVAQGIGQAVSERTVYDREGQLLSASFMDYALPRAADLPAIPFHSEPVLSTANAIGMKGCGEAGTVGALAAVTNAVFDALWPLGVRQVDMPATPQNVWSWIQAATSPQG